jgi:hypothetical protein
MFGFLKDSWLGKVLCDVDKKRLLVGLPKDSTLIQNAIFPTIHAIGDESVAKSSTIERLIGRRCLPVGKDIKTRRPIVIHLRYQDESKVPMMKLKLPNMKEEIETNDDQVILNALEKDFEEIKASKVGIDKTEGILWIFSSTVPNVNLVDLPGLMHVAHLDEPGILPGLVTDLVSSYVQKPNSIIMAIMDSNTRERQSPTAGVLRKLKPKEIIKVLTKPDLAIRVDDLDKMGEFVQHLNGVDVLIESTYTVSLKSNFTSQGFDGTVANEMKFFQDNLGMERFESLKSKLGIHALMHHISNLSETASRKDWTIQESKRYKDELTKYQLQLAALGPVLNSKQIASVISQFLFAKPIGVGSDIPQILPVFKTKLEEILWNSWLNMEYKIPGSSILETYKKLEVEDFLDTFQADLLQEIDGLFSNLEKKLFRFEKFKTDLHYSLGQIFQKQKPCFVERWTRMEAHLWNSHNANAAYSEDNWGRAAICCVIQCVLQVMSEFTDSDTLESIMQGFFSQFSNVEDASTCKLRTDIMEKIEAIQNILVLL